MIKTVIKSDGSKESFNILKLSRWADWAKVIGIDHQSLVFETLSRINDEECTSEKLHNELIKTCLNKNTEKYVLMAGKLYLGTIYKNCYGGKDNIPSLKQLHKELVNKNLLIDLGYSDEELDIINNNIIDHNYDQKYNYSQLKQIYNKYSIYDKLNNIYYESPQFTFIRLAMTVNKNIKDQNFKLTEVAKFYQLLAVDMVINNPTPNYLLGTPKGCTSSCCLILAEDNAESIRIRNFIADTMTCASSGIGDMLKCRSIGDGVRNNTVVHQGKLPYYKGLESSVKQNVQSSRGGGATTYINVSDPEIIDLIKARSVTTAIAKRIGGLDFALSHNTEFRKRVSLNKEWPLFSYHYYTDLFESMYESDEKFEALLEKYETEIWPKNNFYKVKYLNARDIIKLHLKEELETGRAYEFNISEVNRHTSFKEKIYQSNLCTEIAQPTKGYSSITELYKPEEFGEISLCTLSAINVNRINFIFKDNGDFSDETILKYEEACLYAAKIVDYVIDEMNYPFPQLKFTAQARRNMAIGINGLAHLMAKLNLKYSSSEGVNFIHKLSELHCFAIHKASLLLAKERGICDWSHKTKYSDGWLPIDSYNKNIDKYINDTRLFRNWEWLRNEMKLLGGLRFSSHVAHMPVESSSITSNSPNSVYPIRKLVMIKSDSSKGIEFIAPDHEKLKNNYELAYDIDPKKMIICFGVIQKFTDQSISVDSWINKKDNNMFSLDDAIDNFLFSSYVGLKTHYYTNTENSGSLFDVGSCDSGACKM